MENLFRRYFLGISIDLYQYGNNRAKQFEILVAYGHYVREGGLLDREDQLRAQTVAVAFRAISTTFQLDVKRNPLEEKEAKYPKRISQSYRRNNLPLTPKLVIPVKVVNHLRHKHATTTNSKQNKMGYLCLITFYYLLRVGEYTYHNPNDMMSRPGMVPSD